MEHLKGNIVMLNAGKFSGKYCFIIKLNNSKNDISKKNIITVCGFKDKHLKRNNPNKYSKKNISYTLRHKLFFKSINIKHIIPTQFKVSRSWTHSELIEAIEEDSLNKYSLAKLNNLMDKSMNKLSKPALFLLLKRK